jgi:hypothetical protein
VLPPLPADDPRWLPWILSPEDKEGDARKEVAGLALTLEGDWVDAKAASSISSGVILPKASEVLVEVAKEVLAETDVDETETERKPEVNLEENVVEEVGTRGLKWKLRERRVNTASRQAEAIAVQALLGLKELSQ